MFVRKLAVHCDKNNSDEITMKRYKATQINEIKTC